jgi:hypothetical protein
MRESILPMDTPRECTAELVEGFGMDPATCWGCPECVDAVNSDADLDAEMGITA